MKEKLTQLYNTLCLIETRGNNTKIMADCLSFLEKCINEDSDFDEQKEG